jgi:RHS repeat-associated protein
MAGISSKAAGGVENKQKYQQYELNTDFDINLYECFYRNHDPQLGRFWQIDPKPTDYESLFAAMGNNPIKNIDILGDTTTNPLRQPNKPFITVEAGITKGTIGLKTKVLGVGVGFVSSNNEKDLIASRGGKVIINGREKNSSETTTKDGFTVDVGVVGAGEVTEIKKDQNGKEINIKRTQSLSLINITTSTEFENTGPKSTSVSIETGIKVGLEFGFEVNVSINISPNYAKVAPTFTDNTGRAKIIPLIFKQKQ